MRSFVVAFAPSIEIMSDVTPRSTSVFPRTLRGKPSQHGKRRGCVIAVEPVHERLAMREVRCRVERAGREPIDRGRYDFAKYDRLGVRGTYLLGSASLKTIS